MQTKEKTEAINDCLFLRKATIDDWKILLDWRNDIETRRNSHNMESVEEEIHKRWLNSILTNRDRQLYCY